MSQTKQSEAVAAISTKQRALNAISASIEGGKIENSFARGKLEDHLIKVGIELKKGNYIKAFEVFSELNEAIGMPYLNRHSKMMTEKNSKELGFNDAVESRQQAYAEVFIERQQLFTDFLTQLSQDLTTLALNESARTP